MTLLYYDPVFLEHRTGSHPECPGRILPVIRHLNFVALDSMCQRPDWQPVSREFLGTVHAPSYVDVVQAFCRKGGGQIEIDTVVCDRSYDVAMLAAGAVCDAVKRVVSGSDRQAFCLVRPPGHHALADQTMGFCLFNNIAVGCRLALSQLDVERVLIVDWDVHHGNGTQAMFWEDSRVGFLSIHRWPFYPGTGDEKETGTGDALGTTLNLPVEYGTSRPDYLQRFSNALESFAAKIRPQLVMISAGFDAHRSDPVGSLGLESEDFAPLTRAVLSIADQYAEGRIVSVLEGGYNPDALTECVEIHLEELLSHEKLNRSE